MYFLVLNESQGQKPRKKKKIKIGKAWNLLSARWSYLDSCRGLEIDADPPRSDGLLKRYRDNTGERKEKDKTETDSDGSMVYCCNTHSPLKTSYHCFSKQ